MTELEPRLNDADAQKVLARALELQAHQAGTLSVSQVREIAAEMSIPASAVDQALAEYRGAAMIATLPALPEHRTFWRRRAANPFVLALAFAGTTLMLLIVASMAIRLFP